MRVSVVIPVYNAERFLDEAVSSALAQPEVAEVVLVEDGSTDGSLRVCRELEARDARVRVLRHPGGVNRGGTATRQVGIESASEELVALLDADDYFLPGRFRRAGELLRDPAIDGVYEPVGTVFETEAMRAWWRAARSDDVTMVRGHVEPEDLFDVLLDWKRGHFAVGGIVVRRALLRRIGSFDLSVATGDTALFLRMAALGRLVAGSSSPVCMRRMHGDNSIVVEAAQVRASTVRLNEDLLAWALKEGLSPARVESIFRRLLAKHHGATRTLTPIWVRKSTELAFVARLLRRFGGVAVNRHLLRHVARICLRRG